MTKKILYSGTVITLLLVILSVVWTNNHVYARGSPSSDTQKDNTVVRVMLDWTPNTNHIGLYVAKKQGYFSKRNLSVEILPLAETSVALMVGARKADFGISFQSEVIFARAAEGAVPIVVVAALVQQSNGGYASLTTANIRTPKDFIGKKYRHYGTPIEEATITTLLAPYRHTAKDVTFVPARTMNFLTGTQQGIYDFAWILPGWEGIQASIKGIELNYIALRDMNPIFDTYGVLLITSEAYLKNHNTTARTFVQAVQEGYEWAIAHPEEAAIILHEYENTLDLTLVKKSMEYLAPRFQDNAKEWGMMDDVRWERYTKWLQDNDLIDSSFTIEGAYTNSLLQE